MLWLNFFLSIKVQNGLSFKWLKLDAFANSTEFRYLCWQCGLFDLCICWNLHERVITHCYVCMCACVTPHTKCWPKMLIQMTSTCFTTNYEFQEHHISVEPNQPNIVGADNPGLGLVVTLFHISVLFVWFSWMLGIFYIHSCDSE